MSDTCLCKTLQGKYVNICQISFLWNPSCHFLWFHSIPGLQISLFPLHPLDLMAGSDTLHWFRLAVSFKHNSRSCPLVSHFWACEKTIYASACAAHLPSQSSCMGGESDPNLMKIVEWVQKSDKKPKLEKPVAKATPKAVKNLYGVPILWMTIGKRFWGVMWILKPYYFTVKLVLINLFF